MALSLDALEMLRLIGANPQVFADVKTEAGDYAHKLVANQLKASPELGTLRKIAGVLGIASFELLVDGMRITVLRSVVKKLDKFDPHLKAGSDAWYRSHLRELAAGISEPTAQPPKPTRPSKASSKPSRAKARKKPQEFATGLGAKSASVGRKR
jgi:hypothetical protein